MWRHPATTQDTLWAKSLGLSPKLTSTSLSKKHQHLSEPLKNFVSVTVNCSTVSPSPLVWLQACGRKTRKTWKLFLPEETAQIFWSSLRSWGDHTFVWIWAKHCWRNCTSYDTWFCQRWLHNMEAGLGKCLKRCRDLETEEAASSDPLRNSLWHTPWKFPLSLGRQWTLAAHQLKRWKLSMNKTRTTQNDAIFQKPASYRQLSLLNMLKSLFKKILDYFTMLKHVLGGEDL